MIFIDQYRFASAPPVTVTINQGASQADPTTASPIVFDVVFSESVTGFATGDVTLSGTAGATTGTVVDSGDHIHFTVNVTGMTSAGTVIASLGAAVCTSIATGVASSASTSSDNTVTLSPVTVTINQGASQGDPTSASPIVFDVVFSQAVTGFATGDVTLSGTAGATTGTVSGSGTTYTVSVTGMTGAGTVIAAIAGGVCTSTGSGIPNSASTSSDNTVTYSPAAVVDYTIQISSAGAYANNDFNMSVVSGDFLLIANAYRAGGAQTAPAPAVSAVGVQLSGVTSIAASANFDSLGTSRGSARMDRATAASTGTMTSNQLTDREQCIMRCSGISGAPVHSARSTADANDSCNISLASAPSGTVIVIIMYGGTIPTNGPNLSPAAPAGWTKLLDHRHGTLGVLVFKGTAQTFTYSLAAGITAAGGRDVHILEW